MTTKGEWNKFTGSDEQIAEIINSKNGFIVDSQWSVFNEPNKLQITFDDKTNIDWLKQNFEDYNVTKYWIIPDDPLREMKIRQAMTGQPVYIDLRKCIYPYQADPDDSVLNIVKDGHGVEIGIATCNPNWNIPNAEYSFTAFEE